MWKQYLVTGDADFAIGHLKDLVTYYNAYDDHFNSTLGLYWQAPVWDGTEFVAASYEAGPGQEYQGGLGYRPSINSYQYGDARAIANIATLAGDPDTAQSFTQKADALRDAIQTRLWSSQNLFFEHCQRDNNPSASLLGIREYMGFIPWMFGVPANGTYSAAWAALTDSQGFQSSYGPTSVEQRYNGTYGHFMFQADQCCRWDGPSWPFATSQILTAAENLLNDYPAQKYFTSGDYYNLVSTYASTQYRNGVPYVAEAHYPSQDSWLYDAYSHSEDYNHSTFVENIIAGLLGLRAQPNSTLIINPLVPSSWSYFAIENALYHGHNVTVLWDKSGSRYKQGKGFMVWVDGKKVLTRASLAKISVDVGSSTFRPRNSQVNIAANTLFESNGTQTFASFTYSSDDPARVLDGLIFRVGIPQNSRWTSYSTSNPEDWIAIDMREQKSFADVDVYFYADGGGVKIPTSYLLESSNDNATWTSIPQQTRSSAMPTTNARIRITFPQISAQYLRLRAPNAGQGTGWGLSEFQVWTPPPN